MRTTRVTTLTTYYDEVRDVLDDEGGSEEVPDVEVGFRVETPEVGLPEVVLPEVPPPGVRDATSHSSAAFFQYSWLSVRCLIVSGTNAKASQAS